jgi:hypothetical protein
MALRIFLLLRLIAFIGVIYVALHIAVARWSRRPGSRLLWFFEILTAPLIRLAARCAGPEAPPDRLRWLALGGCVAVWATIVLLEKIVVGR